MSVSSIKKFGRRVFNKKKNTPSPFYDVKSPSPAQKKQIPALRETKPDEAKDEITAAIQTDAQAIVAANSDEQQIVEDVSNTVAPSRKQQQKDSTNDNDQLSPLPVIAKKNLKAKSAYAIIWQHESTDLGRIIQIPTRSTYTPNAISLFTTLREMDRCLHDNINITWKYKNYLSFAPRLYYGILYHIRVLSVKDKFGFTTPQENTFLRRFQRQFKPEQLPIAAPLVPFFNAIAAYDSDDERYSYLVPFLPANLGGNAATDMIDIPTDQVRAGRPALNPAGSHMILTQPNVPAMYDWFMRYASSADINGTVQSNANPAVAIPRHNVSGEFVPFPLNTDTARVFAGYTFPVAIAATDSRYANVLGISYPSIEPFDSWVEKFRFWSQSNFALNGPAISTATSDFSTTSQFLRMDESLDWFSEFVSQASIQAKFFGPATPFSALDYVGGPEIGIFTDVTFNTAASAPRLLSDRRSWFVNLYRSATSQVTMYEEGISSECKFTAKHCLVNSKISIIADTGTNAAPAVSTLSLLSRAHGARQGPFYNCKSNEAATGIITLDEPFLTRFEEIRDATVLAGRSDLIQNEFYIANPL